MKGKHGAGWGSYYDGCEGLRLCGPGAPGQRVNGVGVGGLAEANWLGRPATWSCTCPLPLRGGSSNGDEPNRWWQLTYTTLTAQVHHAHVNYTQRAEKGRWALGRCSIYTRVGEGRGVGGLVRYWLVTAYVCVSSLSSASTYCVVAVPKEPGVATEAALARRQVVAAYNADPRVHGILVQLPLPKHISEKRILDAISIEKDVDGFHPLNIGALAMRGRNPLFVPCTPKVGAKCGGVWLAARGNGQHACGGRRVTAGVQAVLGCGRGRLSGCDGGHEAKDGSEGRGQGCAQS